MEAFKSFIKRQPSYRLVILALLLLALTYFSPRFVGIVPGVIGMATCIVLFGRAVGKTIDEKHLRTERPWWTNL
jgi:hypothetical protein